LEVVKYLVGISCDKNVKNNNGDTPLHSASNNGHLELVKYLVGIGCDKNAKNNNGDTPLQLALRFCYV
jgi:ankyrin repeat protein